MRCYARPSGDLHVSENSLFGFLLFRGGGGDEDEDADADADADATAAAPKLYECGICYNDVVEELRPLQVAGQGVAVCAECWKRFTEITPDTKQVTSVDKSVCAQEGAMEQWCFNYRDVSSTVGRNTVPFYHEKQYDGASCVMHAVNHYYGYRLLKFDMYAIRYLAALGTYQDWVAEQISASRGAVVASMPRDMMVTMDTFVFTPLSIPGTPQRSCCNITDLMVGKSPVVSNAYSELPYVDIFLLLSVGVEFDGDITTLTYTPHVLKRAAVLATPAYADVDRAYVLTHRSAGTGHAVVLRKDVQTGIWYDVDSMKSSQTRVDFTTNTWKDDIVFIREPSAPCTSASWESRRVKKRAALSLAESEDDGGGAAKLRVRA